MLKKKETLKWVYVVNFLNVINPAKYRCKQEIGPCLRIIAARMVSE